jgi:iron complex transport system substrate-binding protein
VFVRVVSLLPSCTEVLFALGQRPVGVSHSCDHPLAVTELPAVTSTPVEYTGRSAEEIDAQMRAVDGAVYDLDIEELAALDPDLVVTQATCDVCAVDASQVKRAVTRIGPEPDILTLDPHSFSDALADIERVGRAAGRADAAETLTAELAARVEAVEQRAEAAVASNGRPRTAVVDWTDPPLRAGHWVGEMITRAGGDAAFQPAGASEPVNFEAIRHYDPEVLVVAPCGFERAKAVDAVDDLRAHDGWNELTAVKTGRVYAVDGNALFNRPSHRLVESYEVLQWCLHPAAAEPLGDELQTYVTRLSTGPQTSV